MTEQEAAELYDQFLAELRQSSVSDDPRLPFPEAVEREVAQGRTEVRTLKFRTRRVLSDAIAGERTQDSASRGEFVGREPFTAKQQLDILAEGTGLARVAPALMSQRLLNIIRRVGPANDAPTLVFTEDAADEPRRVLYSKDIEDGAAAVSDLQAALEKLRAENGGAVAVEVL